MCTKLNQSIYTRLCPIIVVTYLLAQAGCGSEGSKTGAQPTDSGGMATPAMGGSKMGGMQGDAIMGGNANMAPQKSPKLVVLPGQLEFVGMPDTPTEPKAFTFQNQGDAPLIVRTLSLEKSPGKASEHFSFENSPQLPLEIAPGGETSIRIVYTAPDNRSHESDLVVESDDPDKGYLRLGLRGRNIQDRVTVSPTQVNLGSVPIGTVSAEFKISVINGDVPHTIRNVSTNGQDQFLVSAADGGELDGRELGAGIRVDLQVKYANEALMDGEVASTQLTISFAEDSVEPLTVNLTVTGRASQECTLIVTENEGNDPLARIDFGYVRIKTEKTKTLRVTNLSGVACRVKSTEITRVDGDELARNQFTVSRTLDLADRIIEPMATHEMEVTYAPQVDYIRGDEWRLVVAYASQSNEAAATNLTTELAVAGVGAPALLGPTMPAPSLIFSDVTITDERSCASRSRAAQAQNVGFVPFCITGAVLEGDHCSDFIPVNIPAIDACYELIREPAVNAVFEYQFEPTALGERRCELVVTGDTDGADVLRIELNGQGVETDETRDVRVMGDVNREREQTWDLSRPAVANTIQLTWVLPANPDAGRNEDETGTSEFTYMANEDGMTWKIKVAPDHLPPKGANIDIVYQRWCFARLGL